MRKGFSGIIISLILAGMTLAVGFGGSEMINESQTDGCHSVRIFLRNATSGLLFMELEENGNISKHLSFEQMPESLSLRTDEDIVYSRDDGDLVYGLLKADELKAWLGCREHV